MTPISPLVPQHERHAMQVPQHRVTRRRFLGSTAATTCGMVALSSRGLGAHPISAESDFPSTAHFWYRLQPAGPYMDSQRDDKVFGFTDDAVLLSDDVGRSWPHSHAFPDAPDHLQPHSEKRQHPVQHKVDAVSQHGQSELVPADHGERCGWPGLPAPYTAKPGQPRLVLPPALGRQLVGCEWRGDARVGKLLQRRGRCHSCQHLLLNRQRAECEDRLCLRAESPFSRRRVRGRRRDRHAAGRRCAIR